jgi:hypothetical protein
MSAKRNVSILVVAFVALALVSVTSGASEWELSPSSERAQLADVSMQEGVIMLTPRVEFKTVRVTINGPNGTVFEKIYNEAPIAWRLDDSQGKALADGRYSFEVRFFSGVSSDELEPSEARERSKVINGGFSIENGVVNTTRRSSIGQADVADLRKPMVKDFSKANNYAFLWVSDKIGVGLDDSASVPGAELHMQQAGGAEILLEERAGAYGTTIEGQWRISGRDTQFTIGHRPNGTGTERENIVIEENAPQNQLYMDSSGRIGFGTAAPTADFHIASTNGEILIEDTDGSTWSFVEAAGDMWFRLITPQSGVGTAGIKMVIDGTGEVGMGTSNPTAPLHVFRSDGTAQVYVQEGNGTSTLRTQFRMVNNGPVNTQHETGGAVWRQQFQDNAYALSKDGTGGNEVTIIAGSGNMTIRGSLFTGGPSCGAGCDAVLGPDFELESIEEHAAAMWSAGFLPAIGSTVANEPMNMTEKMGGVLNELEKAHIYIEQLHQELAQQKEQLQRLEALLTQ